MEHETDAFDVTGFLDLLSSLMPDHGTGVLSARIHIRDGVPWAICVQFDRAAEKAA